MHLADQIQSLYAKFGALKGITIELHKQLIAVAVRNEAASATIFLQGAQVAEYCRVGEPPVLWLSEQCDYQASTALRGGIPVCWPWFGDLQRNPDCVKAQIAEESVPAHGFVREQEWSLQEIELIDSETTRLLFELSVQPQSLWSFPARLRLYVTVGTELELQLEVNNSGDQPFSFTSALHSYFNLSHISAAEVRGLEGCTYLDTLDGWQPRVSDQPLRVSSEVDRVYPNLPAPVSIHDARLERTIHLQAQGARDLVVWNPWIDKAQRLSHFADSNYQQMICLETAHLLDNACTLLPQQSWRFGVRITTAN